MKWINRLERKYRHLAIKGLITYVIVLTAFVYLLMMFDARYVGNLILIPSRVFQGEIWRLVTFLFIPPTRSPIFILFVLYFYYLIGSTLEESFGSFKFTIYYLIGVLGTILGAFLSGMGVTAIYLNLSLFLAFARLYPDFQVLLFFILPVKVKYLAYFNWLYIVYTLFFLPLPYRVAALASLINYFLFFGQDLIRNWKNQIQITKNRRRFSQGLERGGTYHSCKVCKITEKDDPNMEFRYCSKCTGNYEYCQKHLFNHEHQ